MKSWAVTDKGIIRKQNQDAFYTYNDISNELGIFLVCDGMGGAKAGNVASTLSVEVFKAEAKRALPGAMKEDIPQILCDILRLVNSAVYELSKSSEDFSGMGTTLVTAVVSSETLTVANIGDSRAYFISHGGIRQITKDHSVVEDMVSRGDITREQSRDHPNKNLITRAVGTMPTVECDTFSLKINSGDYVLLCSDGLTKLVSDEEICDHVVNSSSPQDAAEQLLKMSIDRGAPDNVTIVIYCK